MLQKRKKIGGDSIVEENVWKKGIYIDNAGLILLAPCVPPLFEKLGWIENGIFKNQDFQERAVHLLQYVVGLPDHNEEHFLPLNKILCGLEIQYPIQLDIEISKEEKNEADQFINAMIKHWSALKNTSKVGLQETYLKRNGKLLLKDDQSWNLVVENKTLDILINKLPWGFSIIKHKWMNSIIKTEWFY